MPTKRRRKKHTSSGAARMKELGHVLVAVWVDPVELLNLKDAAKVACRPLASYVRDRAVSAAAAELGRLVLRRP